MARSLSILLIALLALSVAGCITVTLPEPAPAPPKKAQPPAPAPAPQPAAVPPVVPKPAPPPVPLAPSEIHVQAAEIALGMLGRPYRSGGNSPQGFDCSGLIQYSYARIGLALPRDTQGLLSASVAVPEGDLRVGDLVFFHIRRRTHSHVGIYLGEGKFLHAPASGGVVRVERLDVAYWAERYAGARRLLSWPEARNAY